MSNMNATTSGVENVIPSSMKIGAIKKELESYGISTRLFIERSELITALETAREAEAETGAEALVAITTTPVPGDADADNVSTTKEKRSSHDITEYKKRSKLNHGRVSFTTNRKPPTPPSTTNRKPPLAGNTLKDMEEEVEFGSFPKGIDFDEIDEAVLCTAYNKHGNRIPPLAGNTLKDMEEEVEFGSFPKGIDFDEIDEAVLCTAYNKHGNRIPPLAGNTLKDMEEEVEFGSFPKGIDFDEIDEAVLCTAYNKRGRSNSTSPSPTTMTTRTTTSTTQDTTTPSITCDDDDTEPQLPSLNSVDNNDEVKLPSIRPRRKSSGVFYGNQDDEDEDDEEEEYEATTTVPRVYLDKIEMNTLVREFHGEDLAAINYRRPHNDSTSSSTSTSVTAIITNNKKTNTNINTNNGKQPSRSISSSSSSNSKAKSASLPSVTVEYLKAWMMSAEHIAHPYPTAQEKVQIMNDTGIEFKQLTNWFVNNRKRYWKPRVDDDDNDDNDDKSKKKKAKKKEACAFRGCPTSFTRLSNMYRHFRAFHWEKLAEDGSSEDHGIPQDRAPRITRPNGLKSDITEKSYQYIVRMIGLHIQLDYRNDKFTAHHKYFESLLANPIARHKLAQEIVEVLIKKTMLTADAIDDAGGNLPDGIILEPFGGVLRLTLDRKDNNLPHFLKGQPVAKNIHFVALGMNTSANIVCLHGRDTCKELRAKVEESNRATPESLDINVSEQQDAPCTSKNKLYCSSNNVYQYEKNFYKQYKSDKKMVTDGDVVALEKFHSKYPTEVVEAMNQFRLDFPTCRSVYDFSLSLFTKQKGKCAISKILMINEKGNTIYQPSLDAIFPIQRHAKSNLRLICRFLNSTNMSKISKNGQTDSGWTPAVFSSYIALPGQDKINN